MRTNRRPGRVRPSCPPALKACRGGRPVPLGPTLWGVTRPARTETAPRSDDHVCNCAVNQVLLSGVIAGNPEPGRTRGGDATSILLVCFREPGENHHWGASSAKVEVLDQLLARQRRDLRPGATCFIAGELMGSGLVWANLLTLGAPAGG